MNSFLRQSTASQTRIIGPFVDDTDFKTLETGLTIANTDIKLSINGGASANKNSGGGTHIVNGTYAVTFDATDTATVGELSVSVLVSGAMVQKHTFWVLEEAIYDAKFGSGATGLLPANVTQLGGVAQSLTDLKHFADSGYDPATGKVEGVKLVDTTNTNTDMRGTDSALTTLGSNAPAGWINEASIATGALTAAKFATGAFDAVWTVTTRTLSNFGTLVSDVWSAATRRLTDSTLSGGGTIATAADIAGITQAQRVRLILPSQIERPDSGSTTYRLYIYAYDANHVAEDLDSNPTVTAANASGTDRSSNLGTVTKPTGTGVYYVDYTLSVGDDIEQLIFQVTATEGAVATEYATTTQVVDTTAVDFTATDRANLASILEDTATTIPGLIGTAQADLDTITGTDGVTLATTQGNYAPAKAGDQMDLVDAPNATAVTAIQSGLTTLAKLLNYVRLLARKDAAVATDLAAELAEINANTGTGTGAYSNNDSQESIRDNQSGGGGGGVTGPGARVFEYICEVSGAPVSGVKVWISNDDPWTEAGIQAGTLITGDAGKPLVDGAPEDFLLDDDTVYYLWRDSSQYNFTNPIQFRYSTANARWEKWNGAAYEAWV